MEVTVYSLCTEDDLFLVICSICLPKKRARAILLYVASGWALQHVFRRQAYPVHVALYVQHAVLLMSVTLIKTGLKLP